MWEWALALSALDELRPDPESLYVSCLLHDVALGSSDDPTVGCFALHGAEYGRNFVVSHGGDAATAHCVHTAISRHFDPVTPQGYGPEASLLHDAAYLDVAGLRSDELSDTQIADVLMHYPRDGFGSEFSTLMRYEAHTRPRSTAATLWRGGMRLAIALNPLDR